MNESLVRSIIPAPILVAGDVMVDEYIIGNVERVSPESPVPVLVVKDRFRTLGGAGNVVKNLSSLGAGVALFATVGDDAAGRWFRNHCEEMRIETFWVKEDRSRPTTIKTRVVARNQHLVRIDEEHVTPISRDIEESITEDIHNVLDQVQGVVISDYGKGFLTPRLLEVLIGSAAERGLPVLVDPKGQDFVRYRGAGYITPNQKEASGASGVPITDEPSLIKAGRVLIDQTNARGIVITRGKDGSTLVTPEGHTHFSVEPVEMIDVTGAGDTVVAVTTLALAAGLSIEEAIELANLAASIVVSRFGAATVTLEEMIGHLNARRPNNKVLSIDEVAGIIQAHRIHGKRIVFTNGCFDIFHHGHLRTLRKAAELGDILVLGINSDASVKRIKGNSRPVMPQAERVELVSAFELVDYVVVFDEDTPERLIQHVRPDILVKGSDWHGKQVVGADVVESRGGRVEFVDLVPGISTTNLIERIRAIED